MPIHLGCRAPGQTSPWPRWPSAAPASQRTRWPMSGATMAGNTRGGPPRVDPLPHAGARGAAPSRLWRDGLGPMTCWESAARHTRQQGPGLVQGLAVARANQAVIPDLDNVVRQDVRQAPAAACLGWDGAELESPRLGGWVCEGGASRRVAAAA